MRGIIHVSVIALASALGAAGATLFLSVSKPADAASNDRYGDYIMATGAVAVNPRIPTDGVWLLDYKAGKLLGTVIDRNSGKIVGWAEVDLTTEFGLARKADVHFLMTTGYITQGQSALYLAETTTGQFGVYTMGPGPNGVGIVIRRHDLTRFREVAAFGDGGPPPGGGGGIPPAIPPAGGGGIQPPAGGGIGNPAGGGVVIPPASLPGGSSGMPTIPGGGTIPALPPPPTGGPQTPVPPPAGLPTIPKSGLSGSGEIGPQGGKINPGHLLTDAHPPSPAGGRISPAAYEPQSSGTTYPSTPSRVNTALAHTDPSSTGKRLSTPSPNTWPSSEPRSAPPENSHQTPPGTQPGSISTTSARLPQISPLAPLRNDPVVPNYAAPNLRAEYPPQMRGYPSHPGMYNYPPYAPPPIDPMFLLQHFLRPLSLP